MHDHAAGYAERGWPIFPTRPDKMPLTPHGHLDASTDPADIARWWEANPAAGIGLATGSASGVIVLDIDDGGRDRSTSLSASTASSP